MERRKRVNNRGVASPPAAFDLSDRGPASTGAPRSHSSVVGADPHAPPLAVHRSAGEVAGRRADRHRGRRGHDRRSRRLERAVVDGRSPKDGATHNSAGDRQCGVYENTAGNHWFRQGFTFPAAPISHGRGAVTCSRPGVWPGIAKAVANARYPIRLFPVRMARELNCAFRFPPFAGRGSIADFNLPPRALKPEPRAGDVAAIRRRPDRPREWRPGPRISAEAKVAGADNPGDRLGRVGKRLGARRARRRESAERNSGHERGCSFRHAETLRPQKARAGIGPRILTG